MTKSKTEHDINLFRNTVFASLEALDTPRSLGLFLRLKDGQKPLDFDVSPCEYDDAGRYLKDAQAFALIKKNPWFFPRSEETKSVALEKFLAAESRCFDTNSYFRYANFRHERLKHVRPVLERARNFISKILGEFRYGQCDFGPGSSLSLSGKATNIVTKLRTNPESTGLAYSEYRNLIIDQIPHYAISAGILERDSRSVSKPVMLGNIVKGNRFSTVPKDWKTDRPICVEPLGNMLLQKAIGDCIRQRLRKFGLDLDNVPKAHGEYVKTSSVFDCYATIDLVSASDTISFSLVKSLLPFDWFDKLNIARSHYTEMPDGTFMYNEKFSSMGNGFTFELESLIFYSLCLAVRSLKGKPSDLISVFGDDIIVEQYLFQDVVIVLEACGFTINPQKSFASGSFFESCGYDYYNGLLVRPVYLKEIHHQQRVLTFYSLANRIRQISHRVCFDAFCDISFKPVWTNVLRGIPKSLWFYGPSEYGDNVLLSPRADWRTVNEHGCLRIKCWKRIYNGIKPRVEDAHHTLACALYGIPSRGVNSRVCSYRIRATFVSAHCSGDDLDWR